LNALLAIAAIVAGAVVLITIAIATFALRNGLVSCPRCGQRLPVIRRPASEQQALYGGWTCSGCGAELERDARLLS
jgi:transposase-like protein